MEKTDASRCDITPNRKHNDDATPFASPSSKSVKNHSSQISNEENVKMVY